MDTKVTRYRQSDVREDGMVFWQYYSSGNERWVTRDKFNELRALSIERCKARYHRDIKKARAELKVSREKFKEKRIQQTKDWRRRNPDKCTELQRSWRRLNRERFKTTRRIFMQRKKSSDPTFKLRCNISTLIQNGLRKMGYPKKSRTAEILGCSFDFFKNYIEERFLIGMSWENRMEWHLDHIIPVSSAKTEEELLKLNHYSNFQPLWAQDNIKKGNRCVN